MNARAEAVARVHGRYDARVLEPSPPAVKDPPWFADDPIGRDEPASGKPTLSPVAGGEVRWADLLAEDPTLAPWCAERWLAAFRLLEHVPAKLPSTRAALHRLAEEVISPAREHANGKIGLRFTRGGFGTPFFGNDVQLRVLGQQLIVATAEGERSAPITTLARMAAHVGRKLLPAAVSDSSALDVDRTASAFLGDWFGFGASVLEELRAGVADELEPSRVQLWPEHFDMALELGSEQAGARAAYGLSPGDDEHDEPYAYVAPWSAPAPGPLWQATSFTGAELGYAEIVAAGDQREAVLKFLRARLHALTRAERGQVLNPPTG
jgi:hypothetical protein